MTAGTMRVFFWSMPIPPAQESAPFVRDVYLEQGEPMPASPVGREGSGGADGGAAAQ